MNLDDYADKAMTTLLPTADNLDYAVGLIASEGGELLGHWTKSIRDDPDGITPERYALMDKEVGDILWGCALYARKRERELSSFAQANLDKLGYRAERGVIGGSGDNR